MLFWGTEGRGISSIEVQYRGPVLSSDVAYRNQLHALSQLLGNQDLCLLEPERGRITATYEVTDTALTDPMPNSSITSPILTILLLDLNRKRSQVSFPGIGALVREQFSDLVVYPSQIPEVIDALTSGINGVRPVNTDGNFFSEALTGKVD